MHCNALSGPYVDATPLGSMADCGSEELIYFRVCRAADRLQRKPAVRRQAKRRADLYQWNFGPRRGSSSCLGDTRLSGLQKASKHVTLRLVQGNIAFDSTGC